MTAKTPRLSLLAVVLAALCIPHDLAAPAQTQSSVPPPPATETSCCGPITPAGQQLLRVLDNMDVEHLWISRHKVDWRTGEAKGAKGGTHCSAFAAAVGERLGIYMLRPPEHSQNFLASAQGVWFQGEHAFRDGWAPVATGEQAQTLANQGNLVVIVFISPAAREHGHIALVRPFVKSAQALAAEGPQTIQAGLNNFASGTALRSFALHQAWPQDVRMYAHATRFASGASTAAEAAAERSFTHP